MSNKSSLENDFQNYVEAVKRKEMTWNIFQNSVEDFSHSDTVIMCILPALDVSPHLDFTRIAVGSCQFNPPLHFTRIFEFNPHYKF